MSYILDALKKSEQEKTLGKVPTLETVAGQQAYARRQGFPLWLNLLIMVALLFSILAILYLTGWIKPASDHTNLSAQVDSTNANEVNQASLPTPSAELATTQPNSQPQVQLAANSGSNIAQSNSGAEDVAASQLTQSNQSAAIVTQQAEAINTLDNVNRTEDDELAEIAAAQQQVFLKASQATLSPTSNNDQSNQVNQVNPVVTEPASASANLAQAQIQDEPQEQTNAAQAQQQSAPDYEAVLHQNLRNIAVNVVTYSSDPRARFVMLDLNIYKEGDDLPAGAQIIEIIQSGAIVDYQNKRYLLKP